MITIYDAHLDVEYQTDPSTAENFEQIKMAVALYALENFDKDELEELSVIYREETGAKKSEFLKAVGDMDIKIIQPKD